MSKERIAEQLRALHEIKGPVTKELRNYVAAQNTAQKAILDALKDGPKSVPELAAVSDLAADKVLWHVAALRKYGKIGDIPGRATYPKYTLKNRESP